MYSINDLRVGTAVQLDGAPYIVLSSQHSKMGRGGGIQRTTLKNLLTGGTIQKTFQGNDKIEPADVSYTRAQYIYSDNDSFFFMDNNNYEQFPLPKENIGDLALFMVEGQMVDVQNINGNPANVKLLPKVNLKVVETDPGVKGDTASGGTKPAKLETGLTVQVPLFIDIGDTVRVNTESGVYVERV